jgi:hypothetical protein
MLTLLALLLPLLADARVAQTLLSVPEAGGRCEILYIASGALRCVASDGSHSATIASDRQYGSPSWNRKGTEAALEIGAHDGQHRLAVINDRGTILRELPQSEDFIRPVWDASGRICALTYKSSHVGRWSSSGRELLPIEGKVAQAQMLALSPSGQRVAILDRFTSVVLAHFDQALVVDRRLNIPLSYIAQPVWLDESTLLLVGRSHEGQPAGLFTFDTSTEKLTAVPTPDLDLRDFVSVSPDHRFAVVCGTRRGKEPKWSLWVVSLDAATKPRRITSGREDVEPAWR